MNGFDRTHRPDTDEIDPSWDDAAAEALLEDAPAGGKSPEPMEDSVQLYLREIGQVSLLTAADEVALAEDIVRGREAYQRLQQRHGHWPWSERIVLEREVALGDEARRRLIQANLRLVVSVAKKYLGSSLSFMDLVQEGNIGLMRAVEKFDHTKGNRFSTYATWWIRQAVSRAIAEQSRLIRLPVHLSDAISQLRRGTH